MPHYITNYITVTIWLKASRIQFYTVNLSIIVITSSHILYTIYTAMLRQAIGGIR